MGRGGVMAPLHADALLDGGYRDPSANLTDDYAGGGDVVKDSSRGVVVCRLADPAVVLEFDFASGAGALPPPTGRSSTTTVVPTSDGSCHGVLFWWELDLRDGGDGEEDDRGDPRTYSTAPSRCCRAGVESDAGGGGAARGSDSHWQDHWQQCLFVFGDSHSPAAVSSRELTRGVPVTMIASHDDTSISFSIDTGAADAYRESEFRNDEDGDTRPMQRRKMEVRNEPVGPQMNRHISAQRALQLNDSSRIRTLTAAIRYCIDARGRDAPLLDLSDFGLCAMIASVSGGARTVTSLESSTGNLPTVAATVAQVGNGLPRAGAEFQVIHGLVEHISADNVIGGAAEIVVAEPYYEILEGWHIQEALNYFYTVRSLVKRGVISPAALSVPAYANVMACMVEFDDFFSAYGKVGVDDRVSGFRHSSVNYYGDRYHTYDVSLPLWQYRYKRISKSICVAKMSYEGEAPTIETGVLIARQN